jgi:hypothetical protein
MPFSGPQFLPTASQLAAMQRALPGVQPAARSDKKKTTRLPFSGPQFLPTCYESYVVVAVNTDIPQQYNWLSNFSFKGKTIQLIMQGNLHWKQLGPFLPNNETGHRLNINKNMF